MTDPDDELLDDAHARDLATLVEDSRLIAGAVRYGRVGRVGCARVVVNTDDPLPTGNHACALTGTPSQVGATLLKLERTFADVGRREAVVYASPTTEAEIEGIADDAGWYAADEELAMVYQPAADRPALRHAGMVRPATDTDLPGVVELLGDDLGLPLGGGDKLTRYLGQRLDDPRCLLLVADDPGLERVLGCVVGFADRPGVPGGGIGLLEHVVVRPGRRRHGWGWALVDAAVRAAHEAGALLVVTHVAEGSGAEWFVEACGFTAAYPVTSYVRRVDEMID
ncbi:hypothetical protein GCM10012275_10950 [Longimycelium tulufanense]|uniref:N-acetyltransferase domain-containing protein n=1 Tax=Longimycelium tulufanense TaxID=907463 RepID=A0A8J3C8Q0_9PSEU|nr:GNAT family N-acetyltransferase [Longimycelium tulufanense]GGM41795.1 hypothetical protein GCM10012275_10950 [Longimycelium tulufanense]